MDTRVIGRRPRETEALPAPVRRRLNVKTDPDMIAVIEACEEPEPEMDCKQEKDADEELQAAKEEFDRPENFDAFEVVDPTTLTTRPLDMIWVSEHRSGKLKKRLCVRGFQKTSGPKDSLYSPTPFPETMKVLLALAHLKGYSVCTADVSRAFLHSHIKEEVAVWPPAEWQELHQDWTSAWLLHCSLYGLKEAMVDWDDFFAEVATGQHNDDSFEKHLHMRRLKSDASALYAPGTASC